MNDERLEALLRDTLSRDAANAQTNEAAAMRVLARLGSLPRQKVSFWHLPGILLELGIRPGLAAHGGTGQLRRAWLCHRHCRL